MISFQPFWDMMKKRQITTYMLEYDYDLNPSEISRLKHNHNFSMNSLNRFCAMFQCHVEDIILYVPDDGNDKLKQHLDNNSHA
jgi:DNA-binding Xre family transcriptional regulator